MWITTATGKLINSDLVYEFSYEHGDTIARGVEGLPTHICNHDVVNEISNALEFGQTTIVFKDIKQELIPDEQHFDPYKVNWVDVRQQEQEVH